MHRVHILPFDGPPNVVCFGLGFLGFFFLGGKAKWKCFLYRLNFLIGGQIDQKINHCDTFVSFSFVVVGLVTLSYVPNVILSPPPTSPYRVFDLVVFNVLVVLLLASYTQCAITDPGTVPAAWHDAVEKVRML